jgi:inositol phosphorylceramide synthase catalytic subunit
MEPNHAWARIRQPECPDRGETTLGMGAAETRMAPETDPSVDLAGSNRTRRIHSSWLSSVAPSAVSRGAFVVSGIATFPPASPTTPWLEAAFARLPQRWRRVLHLSLLVTPFLAVLGIYESLRGAIRHSTTVHVADLLALEERFFSVVTSNGHRTLSELIARSTHPLLDLWCGLTYLLWLPEVFAMTVLLFMRARPKKAWELAVGFLAVNLAGWVIWLLYPAAPPWYVDSYGTGALVIDAPASTAGMGRLDALLGLPIAETIYSKSAYIFGAMPSLHVAYATLVATVVFPLGGRWRVATLGIAASMAFAAVYLRHHYILDVVAGVALAVPVAWVVGRFVRRTASALEGGP